jgi:hypothetical protein
VPLPLTSSRFYRKYLISFTPRTEIGIISPCSRGHAGICASGLVNTGLIVHLSDSSEAQHIVIGVSRRVRKSTFAYFLSRYPFQQYALNGLPNGAIAVETELQHGFRIKGRLDGNQCPSLGTTMPLASTPPAQLLTRSSIADLRRARKQIQLAHAEQLWIFLASVIAFFTVLRVLPLILRFIVVSRSSNRVELMVSEKKDLESTPSTTMRRINSPILRLYAAVATGFRIVAFRWSLPIGPGSAASISELTFIFVYIAVMFLWLFLDSMPPALRIEYLLTYFL